MKMLILETNNNENIRIRQAVKNGYTELTTYPSVADLSYPTSKTRRGRVQSMNERERERDGEREYLSNNYYYGWFVCF